MWSWWWFLEGPDLEVLMYKIQKVWFWKQSMINNIIIYRWRNNNLSGDVCNASDDCWACCQWPGVNPLVSGSFSWHASLEKINWSHVHSMFITPSFDTQPWLRHVVLSKLNCKIYNRAWLCTSYLTGGIFRMIIFRFLLNSALAKFFSSRGLLLLGYFPGGFSSNTPESLSRLSPSDELLSEESDSSFTVLLFPFFPIL